MFSFLRIAGRWSLEIRRRVIQPQRGACLWRSSTGVSHAGELPAGRGSLSLSLPLSLSLSLPPLLSLCFLFLLSLTLSGLSRSYLSFSSGSLYSFSLPSPASLSLSLSPPPSPSVSRSLASVLHIVPALSLSSPPALTGAGGGGVTVPPRADDGPAPAEAANSGVGLAPPRTHGPLFVRVCRVTLPRLPCCWARRVRVAQGARAAPERHTADRSTSAPTAARARTTPAW